MIPTTVTGILLLLILLVPGFLFVTLREQHRPTRRLSTFRETSVVLAATTISYAVPVLLIVAVAVLWPWFREELARALVSPADYQRLHPFRSVAAGAALVVIGSGVAAVLGSSRRAILTGSRGGSAWWEVFEPGSKLAAGTTTIQVTATLDDGTEVTGVLHSWSRDGEDGPDRDFVLVAPIWIQAPEQTHVQEVDAASIVISARSLRLVSARYFSIPDEETGAATRAGNGPRSRLVGVLLGVTAFSLIFRRRR